MQSCPICYEQSKGLGARPFRMSLSRVAAAELVRSRGAATSFLGCPFTGHMAGQFAVDAVHAANHLAVSSPARHSRMLEEARFPVQEKQASFS